MENKILERVRKEVAEHYELYKHVFSRKSSVVDVGAGTGLAASYLQTKGISVVGLDIRSYNNYLGQKLIIYDGITIPFRSKSFDVALLLYTLHHIKDALRVLKEACRVAKRIVIIEEFPNNGDELECENKVLKAIGLDGCPEHEHRTKEEFDQIIEQYGMEILEVKRLKSRTKRRVTKYLYIL